MLRAYDGQRQREVALKLLLRNDARALKRFEREISAATRLAHPNVVATLESGLFQGRPYLVMDFVPGETLSELVERERSLSITRAVELVREVARGIAYAHSQGVLHRDLKPDNVLVDQRGAARVLDFGLAALADDDAERLTRTGASLGTPHYMSPEQVAGQAADPRTDVYGLGATLFFALTGEAPFQEHENPLMAAYSAPPEPPSRRRAGIPRSLDQLCLRALAKERHERPESVEALIEDLDRFLAQGGATPRRLPRGAAPALAALALAAALGVGAALDEREPPPAPARPLLAASSPSPPATPRAKATADLDAGLRALLPAAALEALVAERGAAAPAWRKRARQRVGVVAACEAAAAASLRGSPSAQLLEVLDKLARSALSPELGRDRLLCDRVRLAQARLALRRGREERALAILSEVREPFAGAREFLRGLALNRLGRWTAGEAVARDMGQASPLWRSLAGLFFAEATPQQLPAYERQIEAQLRELTHLPPEAAFFRLARRASEASDPAALRAVEERLRASPAADDIFLWVLLADRELNRAGPTELGDAARYLERASALSDGEPPPCSLRALGQLRLTQGRSDEAAEVLSRARAHFDRDLNLILLTGAACFTSGRFPQAEQAWRDAWELDRAATSVLVTRLSPLSLRVAAESAIGIPPGLEGYMEPAIAQARLSVQTFPAGQPRRAALELLEGAVRGLPFARLEEPFARAARLLARDERWPVFSYRILLGRFQLEAAAEAVARLRRGPFAHLAAPYEVELALARSDSAALARAAAALAASPRESLRALGRAWKHYLAADFAQARAIGLELLERDRSLHSHVARLLVFAALFERRHDEANGLLRKLTSATGFQDALYLRALAKVGLDAFCQAPSPSPQQTNSTLIRFAILERLGDAEAAGELARAAVLLPSDSPWFESVPYWLYRLELTRPESRAARQVRGMLRLREGRPREEVLACWPPGEELLPGFARRFRERFGEDPPGHSSGED